MAGSSLVTLPGRQPAGLAWALWALALLGIAAMTWLDRLLRQAGRADLALWTADAAGQVLATVSAATVGAVLAGHRPRHPVGWLLLGFALSLAAAGAVLAVFRLIGGRCLGEQLSDLGLEVGVGCGWLRRTA